MISETFTRLLLVATIVIMMPACAIIGGVFKVGVGVGVFMAIAVVGLIFFAVTRTRG